jgi:peroxin-1
MAHPITIYLSPTSTAIINVTQVEPPLGDGTRRPFAILSPQAEVIVAPKLRPPVQTEPTTEGAFDLTGAKNSVASTAKSKKSRRKAPDPSIVLRTICLPHPLFEDEVLDILAIYVNPFIKASPVFSGGLAKISILPSPSKPVPAPDKDKEKETAANEAEFTVAKQLVVKVQGWEDGPEDHVGISPRLARTLGITELGDLSRYHPPKMVLTQNYSVGSPNQEDPVETSLPSLLNLHIREDKFHETRRRQG